MSWQKCVLIINESTIVSVSSSLSWNIPVTFWLSPSIPSAKFCHSILTTHLQTHFSERIVTREALILGALGQINLPKPLYCFGADSCFGSEWVKQADITLCLKLGFVSHSYWGILTGMKRQYHSYTRKSHPRSCGNTPHVLLALKQITTASLQHDATCWSPMAPTAGAWWADALMEMWCGFVSVVCFYCFLNLEWMPCTRGLVINVRSQGAPHCWSENVLLTPLTPLTLPVS